MGCFYLQKPIVDIPARAILSLIRSATYLIKFSTTSSSDKNFTELFAVSQPLSDALGKISWKIVVVGSCYRWFHGKLVFFRNLFSTHSSRPLLVYPRIGEQDCNFYLLFIARQISWCIYFLMCSRSWREADGEQRILKERGIAYSCGWIANKSEFFF